jgi:hypothetical protein
MIEAMDVLILKNQQLSEEISILTRALDLKQASDLDIQARIQELTS